MAKRIGIFLPLFFLVKISFCHSIVIKNMGNDNILISNNDYFGHGSAGLSLRQSDSIRLTCANEVIMISIGYGNGTQNNRFIVLEADRTYLIAKQNGEIIILEKNNEDYFSKQSTQLANSFYKRFKSMQYDFEPFLNPAIDLLSRHTFLRKQYVERRIFLDSVSHAFQLNSGIVENWKSFLYCSYIYNLYNYQANRYLYKDNILQFYKDSAGIFFQEASQYNFLENHITALAYNKLIMSIYGKKLYNIEIKDFQPTANLLLNDYLVSSILSAKLNANLPIQSGELEQYVNICKNEVYKYTIAENIRLKGVQTITSNDFLFIDNTKNIISIDSIVKLSYSKTIYMDFWASWCMPCLKEIKYSQKIRTELLKVNCLYVYISTDDNMTMYENASQQLGLSRYNYSFLAKNKNHDFLSKTLKLSTLPRYIIIRNGKIVNSMAPRPSDPSLLTVLKKMQFN